MSAHARAFAQEDVCVRTSARSYVLVGACLYTYVCPIMPVFILPIMHAVFVRVRVCACVCVCSFAYVFVRVCVRARA